MAQLTEHSARIFLAQAERGEYPAMTLWETRQALEGWLRWKATQPESVLGIPLVRDPTLAKGTAELRDADGRVVARFTDQTNV